MKNNKGLKRSQVVKKIKQIAQKGKNSKIDANCAESILTALEKMGIICPPERIVAQAKIVGQKGLKPVYGMEWAPEQKETIPKKTFIPLNKK